MRRLRICSGAPSARVRTLCDVLGLQANDYRGGIWVKPRQPGWSDMVWQMRNWYYFTWLCGDFNVEQHVHFLDVCTWVMKDQYPVRAVGLGPNKVLSVPDAIGIALEKWMREKQGVQQDLLGGTTAAPSPAEVVQPKPSPVANAGDAAQSQFGFETVNRSESFIGTCPDCGSSLEFAEGCAKCHVCGFSECG